MGGVYLCVHCYSLISGSSDYYVETYGLNEDFKNNAKGVADNNYIFAVEVEPSNNFVTSGASMCRGDYPKDYSILFKLKVEETRQSAVTLLNITNQLTITLDLCKVHASLDVTFGNPECGIDTIQFPLPDQFAKTWTKFSIGISDHSISFYIDCDLVAIEDVDLSGCLVSCNENTDVAILLPPNGEVCDFAPSKVTLVLYCNACWL